MLISSWRINNIPFWQNLTTPFCFCEGMWHFRASASLGLSAQKTSIQSIQRKPWTKDRDTNVMDKGWKKKREKLSSHCWRPLRNWSRALERANLNFTANLDFTANNLEGKKRNRGIWDIWVGSAGLCKTHQGMFNVRSIKVRNSN